jgi:hypothetical protein
VHEVSTILGDTLLNGGHRRRRFGLDHSHLSEYRYQTTYGCRLREVHDPRIAAQKSSHNDLVEKLQPNIFLLEPFAEPGDGISLAGHRRRQESILLDTPEVNIQIWPQRSYTKALKELGINK